MACRRAKPDFTLFLACISPVRLHAISNFRTPFQFCTPVLHAVFDVFTPFARPHALKGSRAIFNSDADKATHSFVSLLNMIRILYFVDFFVLFQPAYKCLTL